MFTCYAVFKSTFQYKNYSLIVYLQWALLLNEAIYICLGGMGLYLNLNTSVLEYVKRYEKIVYAYPVLSSVQIAISNLIHWVLAFKYWSVAKRL